MAKLLAVVSACMVCYLACSTSGEKKPGDDTDPGADTDADSDTDSDTADTELCDLGSFEGSYTATDGEDLGGLFGYSLITGDLTVNCSYCTDLVLLECLTGVGGNLSLYDNESLESVDGLDSLTAVQGNLYIGANPVLTSLESLDGLTQVGGRLDVQQNDLLPALDGLDNLTEIGGDLNVADNAALQDLSGLDAVEEIATLMVLGNDTLAVLDDFSGLTTAQLVQIADNPLLDELSGLNALTKVDEVRVTGNASLTALSGFSGLDAVDLMLEVADNDSLADIVGFAAVELVDGLRISENDELTGLSGLGNLELVVESGFEICGNAILPTLADLSGLADIQSKFTVSDNPLLPYCGVCDLIDQLASEVFPTCEGNLEDDCWVVDAMECP
jgi:hypothetical protein